MHRLPAILGLAALTLFAACGARSSSAVSSQRPAERARAVVFDNVYGRVTSLRVYVTVDGGAEQTYPAACDQKTCTLLVPLTNGQHTLLVSVEQEGKRSEATTVTVDTSAAGAKP